MTNATSDYLKLTDRGGEPEKEEAPKTVNRKR